MTILGAIVRTAPEHVAELADQLARQPGVDVALNPGDGRLILVIEDSAERSAAATLAAIALLDHVVNTSLVYEHSGSDGASPSRSPASTPPRGAPACTTWRAAPICRGRVPVLELVQGRTAFRPGMYRPALMEAPWNQSSRLLEGPGPERHRGRGRHSDRRRGRAGQLPPRRPTTACAGTRRPAASAAPAAASWSAPQDGRVVATQGDPDAPVNRGLNCIKGYFLSKIMYGTDRLTTPMLRMKDGKYDKNGEFKPISWKQAFDIMEEKCKATLKAKEAPTVSPCSAPANGRSGKATPPPS